MPTSIEPDIIVLAKNHQSQGSQSHEYFLRGQLILYSKKFKILRFVDFYTYKVKIV